MITFNIGQTYSDRSICDHNCIFSFTILARTAKSVTVNVSGKTVRRGLSTYNDVEQFKPFGSYSMCSVVSADAQDLREPTDEYDPLEDFNYVGSRHHY